MPVHLTRTVRLCINPGEAYDPTGGSNGFAGKPSMRGLGRYYEIDVCCEGDPDARTGYLVNIKDIDRAVREGAGPLIADACEHRPTTDAAALAVELLPPIDAGLGGIVRSITFRPTPTYGLSVEKHDMRTVILRQRFDFAASHRLHVPDLSDEENRRIFGKCNNPSGHGHNYQVEPAVRVTLEDGAPSLSLETLERLTDAAVVEPFDHTNLNTDTQDFSPAAGVNPSVEHIARVCFERLAPEIERASGGSAALLSMTVWETDRTSSTYAPEPAAAS